MSEGNRGDKLAREKAAATATDPPVQSAGVTPPEQLALGMRGIMASESTHFRGPLPPPDMLADYERTIPGIGKQIVAAFIAEGEHRRESDRFDRDVMARVADAQTAAASRGMLCAFLAVVIFAAVALVAILRGHPWSGVTILGADLVSLVAVFIYGRRAQVKEAEIKSRETEPHR